MALTIKQEKFCLEYAKSGNARQAYIKAGYKHKKDSTTDVNACRLLKTDKVQARLAELAEEAKNAAIADITEMQELLTKIMRQEFEEEVIVFGEDGARKMKKTASAKEIINAVTTLGKMQGAFVEKTEQKVDMDLNITIDYGDGDDE